MHLLFGIIAGIKLHGRSARPKLIAALVASGVVWGLVAGIAERTFAAFFGGASFGLANAAIGAVVALFGRQLIARTDGLP